MENGIVYGMKLRMDKSGRIVVPKPLRRRLGSERGGELEAIEQPEGLLLRPVKAKPTMVRVGGVWIHQGVADPGSDWDRVVDDAREERIRDILSS